MGVSAAEAAAVANCAVRMRAFCRRTCAGAWGAAGAMVGSRLILALLACMSTMAVISRILWQFRRRRRAGMYSAPQAQRSGCVCVACALLHHGSLMAAFCSRIHSGVPRKPQDTGRADEDFGLGPCR